MNKKLQFSNIPAPANQEKAKEGLASFKSEDFVPQSIIEAVFGNSPYLSKLMLSERKFISEVFKKGFDKRFEEIINRINNYDITNSSQEELMQFLRSKKHKVSLLVAIADIANLWNLQKITNALSDFADAAICKTYSFLLTKYSAKNAGFIFLAVGKLGSRELNYSSDIDLIILYEPEKIKSSSKISAREFAIKFSQNFVDILEKRTADGYVFRVDLRLRPDPYSTPIAVSTTSAEIYYENVGQNWERAAMIKARFVTGDKKVGDKYFDFLHSYVWRKYLDFAAISDIHSIKRQIDSKTDYNPQNLYGYNIKLGKGGIREIEFFAQVQQLIWGGRDLTLRSSVTREALTALEKNGHIKAIARDNLIAAYELYRKIEHRLQMVADEHTHTLPKNTNQYQDFAIFLGYKNAEDFTAELRHHLHLVQKYYAHLFDKSPSLGAGGNLVFTGVSSDPETLITLNKMGFTNPERICEIIRGWHHGRRRATRFKRVREILTELVPHILKSFSQATNPDETFIKFDDFLDELPSGVQLFSLFAEKPEFIALIAEIMGNSPWLATNLSRSPALVGRILTSNFSAKFPPATELQKNIAKQLAYGSTIEEKLKIIRRWKHDMEFQVGIRLLKNLISHYEAALNLSSVAEIVIAQILDISQKEIPKKIKGEFVIIAMGKLGNRELNFGSDLDLVFVYDSKESEAAIYFSKLAQKFCAHLQSLSEDGILYSVDTRLRPQGEQGAIATSLEAYKKYYSEQAWNWEFMALTKARVISRDKKLTEKVSKIITQNITKKRDAKKLASDMAEMRHKLSQARPITNPWDIKYAHGGLFEAEFIIQYHILTGKKVSYKNFDQSHRLLQDMQSLIRLICQGKFDPKTAPESQKKIIAQSFSENSFEKTEKKLLEAQKNIHTYYKQTFEE